MGFGQPSWIAVALLGKEHAPRVRHVRSRTVMYGSTAGPFAGIGGAAMTDFQITALVTDAATLFYADDRPVGWIDTTERPLADEDLEDLRIDQRRTPGLQHPETCPFPMPDPNRGQGTAF